MKLDRFNGECVSCKCPECPPTLSGICECPATYFRNRIGSKACTTKINRFGEASSVLEAAQEICELVGIKSFTKLQFSQKYVDLLNGTESDAIVSQIYLDIFSQMSSSIGIDQQLIFQGN